MTGVKRVKEKENRENRTKRRHKVALIGLVLAFAAILLQLVNLQIIRGEYYDAQSQMKLLSEREAIAPRGNIVDRNGVPIAVNRMGYTVKIAKTGLNENEVSELILKLINVFEEGNDSYEQNLGYYLTFDPLGFGSRNKSEDNLERWKRDMVLKEKDIDLLDTPEGVFEYFRKKFYIKDEYTDKEAYKIMTIKYDMLIKGYSATNPLLIAKDVSTETVAQIEERHHEFPGVIIDIVPQRKYINPSNVAHILGYIGRVDDKEYQENKDNGYSMNDLIGKDGIEKTQESQLRGINGKKRVEVDTNGRLTAELSSEPAIPGNDVVLTIDLRLQEAAMESLQRNIERIRGQADNKTNFGDANVGAAVVINVNNGEVLALASYPSYDPSIFLASPSDRDAQRAIQDLIEGKEIARGIIEQYRGDMHRVLYTNL